jgi:hypothetical protein
VKQLGIARVQSFELLLEKIPLPLQIVTVHSESQCDYFVQRRYLSLKSRNCLVDLLARFSALVHMIIQLYVGFATSADEDIAKARLPVENRVFESAQMTLYVELSAV